MRGGDGVEPVVGSFGELWEVWEWTVLERRGAVILSVPSGAMLIDQQLREPPQ